METSMKIAFEAEFFPEGEDIIGHAKGLDVSSCGKSPKEAEDALLEAVELFLETVRDMGTLEEVLRESGFVRAGDEWSIPGKSKNRWLVSLESRAKSTPAAAAAEI
jgi:predicted RNase H-like HicB family nuclease